MKVITISRFGEVIKGIMESKKVTQVSLARMSGVSQQTISSYVSGKNEPTVGRAYRIAKALGVSLDYICSICDIDAK